MKRNVLSWAVVVASLAACSKESQGAPKADNTAQNKRDADGSTKTPFDQSESETDRKVTAEIRRSITSADGLSTNAKNVKIVTNEGAVTLRGPVDSAAEVTRIEEIARGTAGVKSVTNELEVRAH